MVELGRLIVAILLWTSISVLADVWSTGDMDFQPPGNYITGLTGDVTATGPGTVPATLATVNANVGSFGSSTSIPSFTVNAKGLITAASGNVVIAPAGTLTGTTLAANVVNSSLTSVGTITSGTWNGTTIGVGFGGTGTSTAFTQGSVVFADGAGVYAQDNTNFFWDDTNNRLGIGTSTPGAPIHLVASSATNVNMFIDNTDTTAASTTIQNLRATGTDGVTNSAVIFTGGKNQQWTSAASTRDSYLSISTRLNNSPTEYLRLTSDGKLGLSTTTPSAMLDVSDGAITTILGADTNVTTRTDATNKSMRIGMPHYLASEEPVAVLLATATSTTSTLNFGGGSSLLNSPTAVAFYTAADNVTVTGSERARIDSDGDFGIGVTNPLSKLHVDANGKSQASWTTSGTILLLAAATLTDTTGSGTIGNRTAASIARPTFAASGTVSIDDASTLFIANSPLAGTGTTITRAWAIQANSGMTFLGGNTLVSGSGTTAEPQSDLDVSHNGAATPANGGTITISRNDTAVAADDTIFKIQAWNNDSTLTTQNIYANIEVQATQNIATDAAAGRMIFRTTSATAGGSPIEAMRISAAQNVALANGLTPTARLHLDAGNATASAMKITAGSTTGTASTDGFEHGMDASGNAEIRQRENLELRMYTNNTERITVQNDGDVGIGDTTPTAKLEVGGHYAASGSAPSLSSCGGSPTITGTDVAGTVVVGSAGTSCTLTFASAFATAPHCALGAWGTSGINAANITSVSTTVLVVNVNVAAATFSYICMQ